MRALFTFKGRIGRLPFALAMLVAWGLAYSSKLRLIVDMAIHAVDPDFPIEGIPLARDAAALPSGLAAMIIVLALVFAIALPLASLSLLARRLHDFNQSAWLVVPAIALPILVPNVLGATYLPPLGLLILIAVMATIPGTRGPNRFDAAAPAGAPQT